MRWVRKHQRLFEWAGAILILLFVALVVRSLMGGHTTQPWNISADQITVTTQ